MFSTHGEGTSKPFAMHEQFQAKRLGTQRNLSKGVLSDVKDKKQLGNRYEYLRS